MQTVFCRGLGRRRGPPNAMPTWPAPPATSGRSSGQSRRGLVARGCGLSTAESIAPPPPRRNICNEFRVATGSQTIPDTKTNSPSP
ncbi:MAG: hypothetical protein ACKPKO_08820, partial [Candidatus Fonsibacter sp.]